MISSKILKYLATVTLAAAFVCQAADSKSDKAAAKPKPYPLKTCAVSDEKLGDMGDPYVFTHEGREVKLCCKGCLKDFNKESAKYVKKMEAAEKKAK
jgi:hypothetical protein